MVSGFKNADILNITRYVFINGEISEKTVGISTVLIMLRI